MPTGEYSQTKAAATRKGQKGPCRMHQASQACRREASRKVNGWSSRANGVVEKLCRQVFSGWSHLAKKSGVAFKLSSRVRGLG